MLSQFLEGETEARLRLQAARELGDTKQNSAVPILLELARGDSNSEVRKMAVRAIGNLGTPEARQALAELLREGGSR